MALLRKLVSRTVKGFYEVRGPTMASSIAYFSLATMAPLGVLALWLGTLLLGPSSASGLVGSALSAVLGPKLGSDMLVLVGSESQTSGQIAGVISILLLLYGAGSLFLAVQHALDVTWRVRIAPHTDLARHVALRAGVVFATMFLPAVLLLISTAARSVFVSLVSVPATTPPRIVVAIGWQLVVLAGSFLIVALLLTILPDAKIGWGPLALGSGFTAVTWTAGTWAMGLYVSRIALTSRYGAAGALMVLLLWVFLMAQFLVAGARLSYEYATLNGRPPTPRPWAELYEKEPVSRADAKAHAAEADLDHG